MLAEDLKKENIFFEAEVKKFKLQIKSLSEDYRKDISDLEHKFGKEKDELKKEEKKK